MRFLQIYFPESTFHSPYKFNICIGKMSSSSMRDISNVGWRFERPGTNIYNSFYLEIIK